MAIAPLVPGAFRSTNAARYLLETRSQLYDLQRQIATGKKSETYGGLGAQRITSLDLRAKASELKGYQATIVSFQIRTRQLDLGLTQLGKIGEDVRSSTILPQFDVDSSGKTSFQKLSQLRFDEAVDVLNTEINGVRIFSGRSTNVRPVLDSNTLLNGDAAGRAGLKQFISERKAADFGVAPDVGRIVKGGAGTTATLAEDGTHPFGFKLTAASSTTPAITTTLTAGPPANVSFNVAANPVANDQVRVEVTLPDQTKKTLTLVAQNAPLTPPASAGAFEIGATPAATATNLRAALAAALTTESATSLPSASAKAASNAFFAGSINNPPQRISGPPATATALVAGTPANSVIFYQGDDLAPSARLSQQSRVDASITVGVGAQANEEGIRRVLSNLGALISETFNPAIPADKGRYQELLDRVRGDLSQVNGVQRVQDIQVEIAASASTLKLADDRHKTKLNFVDTIISEVEDANQEETAARLLAVQTKLQASYQTTAIVSRLNLTDYLR